MCLFRQKVCAYVYVSFRPRLSSYNVDPRGQQLMSSAISKRFRFLDVSSKKLVELKHWSFFSTKRVVVTAWTRTKLHKNHPSVQSDNPVNLISRIYHDSDPNHHCVLNLICLPKVGLKLVWWPVIIKLDWRRSGLGINMRLWRKYLMFLIPQH